MKARTPSELLAVGFWCGEPRAGVPPDDPYLGLMAEQHEADVRRGFATLPHPARLISILGTRPCDERMAGYLARGEYIATYFGWGVCRCCGAELGTSDLTDGIWVWPQGLEHYLEEHQLPLPSAFLATAARNGYRIPRTADMMASPLNKYDFTFWHHWTASVYAGGAP